MLRDSFLGKVKELADGRPTGFHRVACPKHSDGIVLKKLEAPWLGIYAYQLASHELGSNVRQDHAVVVLLNQLPRAVHVKADRHGAAGQWLREVSSDLLRPKAGSFPR